MHLLVNWCVSSWTSATLPNSYDFRFHNPIDAGQNLRKDSWCSTKCCLKLYPTVGTCSATHTTVPTPTTMKLSFDHCCYKPRPPHELFGVLVTAFIPTVVWHYVVAGVVEKYPPLGLKAWPWTSWLGFSIFTIISVQCGYVHHTDHTVMKRWWLVLIMLGFSHIKCSLKNKKRF